jgi:AmmeMemoRadiSam system protein A
MSPLCSDERRALLALARRAIVEAVCHGRVPEVSPLTGELAKPSGAFVTLHRHGRLCGCIGQMGASESLGRTVAECAIAAALKDPRFRPVCAEEVTELEIEISVLSPLAPVHHEDIEIGRHGLVVVGSGRRGVLLPQVAAQHGWTRERFLEETCAKAGIQPDAWKDPATRLFAFTAEVFSEAELGTARPVQRAN